MNDLQSFWNENSARIPGDKGHSLYAAETEQRFPRTSVVVDLGGGTGTDSLYFIDQGHSVILVDIADEPLARAKEQAQKRGLGDKLQTLQCDFSSGTLPLENEACDIVYSRLALHYFESPTLTKLLAEIYRILRPNGQAYLTLKSPDDTVEMEFLATTATQKEAGVFEEKGRIKTRYSTARLQQILSDAGLPTDAYSVTSYTEKLGNANDIVKSGKSEFIVNEISIRK